MNNSMNMIRPNHKSNTLSGLITQLLSKKMDNNLFGLIVIQKASSPITRKCHKTGMILTIEYVSPHRLPERIDFIVLFLLLLRNPGNKLPGPPTPKLCQRHPGPPPQKGGVWEQKSVLDAGR